MTYPMDEFPQDVYDTAASHFGPGDVDPYLVFERARMIEEQQRDFQTGSGLYAAPSSSVTAQHPEPTTQPKEPPLMDDQEEAYHYLLDTLSSAQRDALLVVSMDSSANALEQLLRVLWREYDREQRD